MSEIIWTKHAEKRNWERQITKNWVEQTVNNPDSTKELTEGKIEYKKSFRHQVVTVVTTKSHEGKYLILSSWVNPPNMGTGNYKTKKYFNSLKKAGNFKKFWLTFLHQIGI